MRNLEVNVNSLTKIQSPSPVVFLHAETDEESTPEPALTRKSSQFALLIPSPTPFKWDAIVSTPLGTPYSEPDKLELSLTDREIRRIDLSEMNAPELISLMVDIAERLTTLMGDVSKSAEG